MLAKTRNKKLGRKLKSDIQTQPSESDVKVNKIQDTGVVFMDKATAEEQKRLEKERFDNAVKDRVSYFCDSNRLDKCYNIIKKYAEVKMSNDEKYKWENDIHENPYKLMKVEGNGFISADKVAMGLNFPLDHKYRILAFVSKALDDNSKGSTILPLGDILVYMGKELKIGNNNRIVDVVLNQSDNTYLMLTKDYKRTTDIMLARFLTKTSWFNSEKGFYKMVTNVNKYEPRLIEQSIKDNVLKRLPFRLNILQSKFIEDFDKYNLNILTGVSGGGKTLVVKAFLDCLGKSKQSYTCLAPTGISSKVFKQSTGRKCSTVHSQFWSGNKIETDWLILEEFSMYSVDHIYMILEMIDVEVPPRLLFVGDIFQLPAISEGLFFGDLIKLMETDKVKGNIIKLTQIMRASTDTFIPHLCSQFTGDGKYDSSCENKELANVHFHKLEGDVSKQILSTFGKYNLTTKDTYVLIPQNIGDIGNNVINEKLDEVFGGNIVYQDKFKTFRKGSILMHIKNNKDLNIFNGEKIELKGMVGDKYLCEKIDDGTEILYDLDTFKSEVNKSYCNSIHKTQGVTVPNIVFVLSKKHSHMLTRELVYTGLSRASNKLIVLYDDYVLGRANIRNSENKRVTFLGELARR
ncbi:MAG: AAA family ATPase [Cetobacterium sp.]